MSASREHSLAGVHIQRRLRQVIGLRHSVSVQAPGTSWLLFFLPGGPALDAALPSETSSQTALWFREKLNSLKLHSLQQSAARLNSERTK